MFPPIIKIYILYLLQNSFKFKVNFKFIFLAFYYKKAKGNIVTFLLKGQKKGNRKKTLLSFTFENHLAGVFTFFCLSGDKRK